MITKKLITIDDIENYLADQSQKYYYDGSNECTDKEWDDLLEYLMHSKPHSKILNQVGWGYDIYQHVGEKQTHTYGLVKGIDRKIRNLNEFPKTFLNTKYIMTAKLDGLSVVCYFVNGHLTKALTRGNGITGIDRTDKVEYILRKYSNEALKKSGFTGAIRGEIVISNENWNKMLEQNIAGTNQRNTAAGLINRDEIIDDLNYVDIVFYKLVGYNENHYMLNKSINDNFDCEILSDYLDKKCLVDYIYPNNNEISQEFLEKVYSHFLETYPCDGIVFTHLNKEYETKEQNHHSLICISHDELAYKFITESAITRVTNISWTMSKGNKAIPVVNVEPTEISGATISNVSAYNAKYVYDNKINVGTKVEIIRSGEVIPKIVNIITNPHKMESAIPTNCPYCGSKLVWDGVDLCCINSDCKNRDEQNLKIWVKNIANVDGISDTLIFKFFDELNINSLNDLYSYDYAELEYKNAPSNSHKGKFNKILHQLLVDKIDIKNALLALNIKRLGDKTVIKLLNNQDFIDYIDKLISGLKDIINLSKDKQQELFNANVLKDISRKCIGEAFSEVIITLDSYSKFMNLKYIAHRINISKSTVTQISNKSVVITGSLSISRKQFETILNNNGITLSNTVNKKTTCLICNKESTSSKYKKAIELQIPILNEETFIQKYCTSNF